MSGVGGRVALLAELKQYAPGDERERTMSARLRAFVAAEPDCFERAHAAGHVTGSAWVIDRAGTAALLLHHRKLGKWLQFGGHADGDADLRRVAEREALEESGLNAGAVVLARWPIYDVDVHDIPARSGKPAHVHFDVRFAFFAERDAVPTANAESNAVVWVPLSEIERYAIDDSVRRLVRKTPALVEGPAAGAAKETSP